MSGGVLSIPPPSNLVKGWVLLGLVWLTSATLFARSVTNDLEIAQQDAVTMKLYMDAKFGAVRVVGLDPMAHPADTVIMMRISAFK